jgi:general secretion pathway protein A
MYESYFGLTNKPFQLTPDPDFFFGSRGHRRAMAYLEYGLHQGEGFIVVTGEVGAGKTTLVRQLLRRLPLNSIVPVQIVSTQLNADDLLKLVATSFGILTDGADKPTLLLRLEEFLRGLHSEGRRALLVVDEAQNLGPRAIEELRMLSNFQIDTKAVLQSFLIGQPELRDLMQRPEMRQLKQRIIAAYHLGPLDAQELRQYVEHRLTHVGWANDPSFSEAAFAALFEVTEGVPRRINTLADRLLLAAFLAEKHTIDESDIQAISSEMNVELGPRANNDSESSGTRANGTNVLQDWGLENGQLSVVAAAKAPSGTISELEERIAMLEATTTLTYGTLKRVLKLLKENSQSVGSPPAENQG